MPPWVPVIITVALGLTGLAIQACLLAYFLGKMKEHQAGSAALVNAFREFTAQTIAQLTTRLDTFDDMALASQADRATINAKLSNLERNTEGLQGLREAFAGLVATFTAHRERQESDMAHVHRSLDGVQRQLGNLATGNGGRVLVFDKQEGGPVG